MSQINAEFDKVYSDNKNITTVLSNHTKILKRILDSSSVNHKELLNNLNSERQLAGNLSIEVNAISRDSFVNSKMVIAIIIIDENNEDIDTAIDSINDGKRFYQCRQTRSSTPTIAHTKDPEGNYPRVQRKTKKEISLRRRRKQLLANHRH